MWVKHAKSCRFHTAYRWINIWNEGGKEGLKKEQGKGGGKPSKMSDEQFEKLEKILREEKEWWITKEVRILKKSKMHHAKPFPHDYRKPANAKELLDNQLKLLFELTEDELKDLVKTNFKTFSKSLSFALGWIGLFLFSTNYYQMLCG